MGSRGQRGEVAEKLRSMILFGDKLRYIINSLRSIIECLWAGMNNIPSTMIFKDCRVDLVPEEKNGVITRQQPQSDSWSDAMHFLTCTGAHNEKQQASFRHSIPTSDYYTSHSLEQNLNMREMKNINNRDTTRISESDSDTENTYRIQNRSELPFHTKNPQFIAPQFSDDHQKQSYEYIDETEDSLNLDHHNDDYYHSFSPEQVQATFIGCSNSFRKNRNTFSAKRSHFALPKQNGCIPASLFSSNAINIEAYESDDSHSIDLDEVNRQILHFRVQLQEQQFNRSRVNELSTKEDCSMQSDSSLFERKVDEDDVFEVIQRLRIYDNEDNLENREADEKWGCITTATENKGQFVRILHGVSGNAISFPTDCGPRSNNVHYKQSTFGLIDEQQIDSVHGIGQNMQPDQLTGSKIDDVHNAKELTEDLIQNKSGDGLSVSSKSIIHSHKKHSLSPHSPFDSSAKTALPRTESNDNNMGTQLLRSCPSDEEANAEIGPPSLTLSSKQVLANCPFDEDITWYQDIPQTQFHATSMAEFSHSYILPTSVDQNKTAVKLEWMISSQTTTDGKLKLYNPCTGSPAMKYVDAYAAMPNSTLNLSKRHIDAPKSLERDSYNSHSDSACPPSLSHTRQSESYRHNHQHEHIRTPHYIPQMEKDWVKPAIASTSFDPKEPMDRSVIKEMALSRLKFRNSYRVAQSTNAN